MFKDKTIEDYLKELSSTKPTPGSGTAAAFVGAEASALAYKSLICSIKKTFSQETKEHLQRRAETINLLKDRFLRLADEDEEAYSKVVKEYKGKNIQKIINVLNYATFIPLKIMWLNHEFLFILTKVSPEINDTFLPEFMSAAELSYASLRSAIYPAEANIRALEDLKQETWTAEAEISHLKLEVYTLMNDIQKKTGGK